MDKDGGPTKAEREMIAVATSSANQCQNRVIAHGAILRIGEDPLIADQIASNYRKADITPRQRAMLDFAMKVSRRRTLFRMPILPSSRAPVQRRRRVGHRRNIGLLRAV